MVRCEQCSVRQHVVCMELTENNDTENYICETCEPRAVKISRALSHQLEWLNQELQNAIDNKDTFAENVFTNGALANSIRNAVNSILYSSESNNVNDSVEESSFDGSLESDVLEKDNHTFYTPGEYILIFTEHWLYNGQIIEIKYDEMQKKNSYKVHYTLWGNEWNECVERERIIKSNDESQKIKIRLESLLLKDKLSNKKLGKRISQNMTRCFTNTTI